MTHNFFFKIFHFIDKYDQNYLSKINKNISVIYRNYQKKININELIKLKNFCKNRGQKVFLANNIEVAIKLKFNGVYIPSFNKKFIKKKIHSKNFELIGSAHNFKEIKIKENQKIKYLFLSPIFESKNQNGLSIYNFRKLSNFTKCKIIALGGIRSHNLKKLKLVNVDGFASINYIRNLCTTKIN